MVEEERQERAIAEDRWDTLLGNGVRKLYKPSIVPTITPTARSARRILLLSAGQVGHQHSLVIHYASGGAAGDEHEESLPLRHDGYADGGSTSLQVGE